MAKDGKRWFTVCAAMAVLGFAALSASAQEGILAGVGSIEHVTGGSDGDLELYDWNAYLSSDGGWLDGATYQLGSGVGDSPGYFEFDVLDTPYTLLLDQPMLPGRPTVVTDVAPQLEAFYVTLPMDYSVAFGTQSSMWGSSPWTGWDDVWYQTFVSTGTSISGISFKMAGTSATSMLISIHEDNGNADVTTWPQVGASRTETSLSSDKDIWVRYRSGEMPTVPGTRYALKLTGQGGWGSDFAMYRRIDGGTGYTAGEAHSSSGVAQNFDLYAMVFSDSDGTVVPYCAVAAENGTSTAWTSACYQEIVATGEALAGVSFYFTASTWDVGLTFRILNGPADAFPSQIGTAKTGRGAYQTVNSGIAGVSWAPGEVPLITGQTYTIEVSAEEGFTLNPKRFVNSDNAYPDGRAWTVGADEMLAPWLDDDLFMQVVEYGSYEVELVYSPVDFDRDGDVDQEDFGRFQACLTGDGNVITEPNCLGAVLDSDADVDGDDYTLFMQCFGQQGVIVDPLCATP